MFFGIIAVTIILYIVYSNLFKHKVQINNNTEHKIVIKEQPGDSSWFGIPNYPYSNAPADVLLNPYAPPLRDERYIIPQMNYIPPGKIPINVSTNVGAVDTNYRQVGILTALNSKGKILALMGRPLFVNRDKWQYYTMSDQNNSVKLPVSKNGRSCTNEYGCDKIYNGDTIYVEGYNDAYKVTIYDNDVIKYLPFI